MEIQLLRADITSLKLDAIVAPSAPAGAAQQNGRATVVTGGNLLARFVIEIPVPLATDEDADARLRDATRDALERADELAVATIGIPVLAKQALGLERVARNMLRATIEYRARARSLHRAIFCLFGPEEHAAFQQVLGELDA